MVKIIMKDLKDQEYEICEVKELECECDETGKKEAKVRFGFREMIGERLKEMEIKDDGYKIFSGRIDKETIEKRINGYDISVRGRSDIRELLDNEAKPQTYKNISLEEIIKEHINPYGFHLNGLRDEEKGKRVEEFTIYPRMSEWEVLKNFLEIALGEYPYAVKDKEIMVSDKKSESKIIISGEGYNGIEYGEKHYKYEKIRINYQVDKLVSDIYVIGEAGEEHIENEVAKMEGIKTKRYIRKGPGIKEKIERQNMDIENIWVIIDGSFKGTIGNIVKIMDKMINKEKKDYVIKKIKYKYEGNEIKTHLMLMRR